MSVLWIMLVVIAIWLIGVRVAAEIMKRAVWSPLLYFYVTDDKHYKEDIKFIAWAWPFLLVAFLIWCVARVIGALAVAGGSILGRSLRRTVFYGWKE